MARGHGLALPAYRKNPQVMQDVSSSAIRGIGYDGGSQQLTVTFNSGRSYAYAGVPYQRYTAFEQANSKGRYFNSAIRNRYPYKRVG